MAAWRAKRIKCSFFFSSNYAHVHTEIVMGKGMKIRVAKSNSRQEFSVSGEEISEKNIQKMWF